MFRALSRHAVKQRKAAEEEQKRQEAQQLYSDNSDEDGDLFVHDFAAADATTGRLVYLQACDELHLRPISNFVDKLSEELVNVRHHGLSEAMVEAMADTLKVNQCIRAIDFGNNRMTDRSAAKLAEALVVNQHVETLDISSNRVTDVGASALCAVLSKHTASLTSLSLAENKLGRKALDALADALYHNTSLLSLDVHGCSISDTSAALLGPSLDANANLQELNLAWNDIGATGGVAIATGLSIGRLRELDLSFNSLGDDVAEAFRDCLSTNNSLTTLDLSHNRIGGRGATALAQALSENHCLSALRLGFNPIGYYGTRAVIRALTSNKKLALLGLENTLTVTDTTFDDEAAKVEEAEKAAAEGAGKPKPRPVSPDKSKAKGGRGKGGAKGKGKGSGKGGANASDGGGSEGEESKVPMIVAKPRRPTVKECRRDCVLACAERTKIVRVMLQFPELTDPLLFGAHSTQQQPRRSTRPATRKAARPPA